MRRRYLDMMISQVDRGYLRAMQRYAKVVQQRNSLLKRIQSREANSGELNFWDTELSHAGGVILQARAEALGHLARILRVNQRHRVKIAVAHMPQQHRREACGIQNAARAADGIGQPRDRHAGVG